MYRPQWRGRDQIDHTKEPLPSIPNLALWRQRYMKREGVTAKLNLAFYSFDIVALYRSSDEEVVITRMIEKIIRRSEAVDREALCILAGQQVCGIWRS